MGNEPDTEHFPESAYEGYEVLVETDGTSHFNQ